MASYTTNYGLHQWEPEDNFLRTDFNSDFKKIDTAIKSVETDLQANLDNEVSRLDGAITTAQQTVQKNLNTQVTRLDGLIDNLEADKAEIITGSYTGDGQKTRTISLGFTPKALLLENARGERYNSGVGQRGGLALPNLPCVHSNPAYVTIVTGGFTVSCYSEVYDTNATSAKYYYLAIR